MQYEGDNMMGVKRTNRCAALRILHEQGGMSRKRLAESIKLTPAAITKIVGEMIDEGLMVQGNAVPSGGAGRREILVELDGKARCALGILINLRQAILSAVWLDGSIIFSEEIVLPPAAAADETLKMLTARLMELVEQRKPIRRHIIGVGIAIRGVTAADAISVRNSFGALDEKNYPIVSKVEEYTGLRAVLANNVRALFSAQMFLSKDKDMHSQFFLRCEYGIGGSLSINDNIWLGGNGQCSEIGHIPVIKRGGKPCACGKSGCLETIASPTAIRDEALSIMSQEKTPVLWNMCHKRKMEDITTADVLEAARNGDDAVACIVDTAVIALGSALKSVIYTLDPEKIVLYGHLFENSYYLTKLMAEMREGVDSGHSVLIEKSKYNLLLENKAAPLLMVEHFFDAGGTI